MVRLSCIALVLSLLACAGPAIEGAVDPDEEHGRALTLVAAELRMHLRDDTYRSSRHLTSQGRNVFELALWRLDRLQRERALAPGQWQNLDVVIEFARARALERLRRYAEAAEAYARVAQQGTSLADHAEQTLPVMRRFAEEAASPSEPPADPTALREWVQARIQVWQALAWEYRDTPFEPLAQEEAESFAMVRVDLAARHAGPAEAVELCRSLIEEHRDSKLFPRHMIRLGDLHADLARLEQVPLRMRGARFDPARYQQHLDRALAAYELASEARQPEFRREAETKIEALLAHHEGVRGDAP
jgi:hypothetical protein